MTALSEDTLFHIEVVKLLLQVAWSDDDLDPEEREQVRASAQKWGIPPADLQMLMARLDEGEPPRLIDGTVPASVSNPAGAA